MADGLMAGSTEEPSRSVWVLDLRGSNIDALALVRRWIGDKLDATALDEIAEDLRYDVLLVAVELVTNAFDHGDGPRAVAVHYLPTTGSVRVEVCDRNRAALTLGASRFGEAANRGRGLVLVDKLTHAWGHTADSDGKIVWARFDGPSARIIALP